MRGRVAALAVGSVASAAIVAAVALGVMIDMKLLSRLSATGGSGNFSDAIYGLEDYLTKDESRPFVAVDWGIYQNLVALSQGRLRGHERWLELSQQANPGERYAGDLTSPTTAYLLHTPGWTNFPRARREFFAIVRTSGRHARLVRVIPSRQGRAVFEVYRVS